MGVEGAEGGRPGGGGGGLGRGRGAPRGRVKLPPNPLEEAKLHRGTSGLIGQAVLIENLKRWGIEGIRIGTSDRFGRGRGEYKLP